MKFTILALSTSLLTATAAPIVAVADGTSPTPLYSGLAFENQPGHNGKRYVDTPYSIYAYDRVEPEIEIEKRADRPRQLYTTKPPTYPLAEENGSEKRGVEPDQTYDYLDYKHLPKRDVEVPYSIYAYTKDVPELEKRAERPKQLYTTKPPTYPLADEAEE